MRILIIEDEFILADAIRSKLVKESYIVDIATDGIDGLIQANTDVYDLIILDVMLPGMDGFEILAALRREKVQSKVIMLTAKSMLEDKLYGLKHGANDYMTKPFHVDELIARVKIQLADPSSFVDADIIKYGDLELNMKQPKLACTQTSKTVDLICKEFQILEYLLTYPEQILSR